MIISIYYWLWIACFGMTILSPAGDETTSQDFDCVSVNASEFSYEFGFYSLDDVKCAIDDLGDSIYVSITEYWILLTAEDVWPIWLVVIQLCCVFMLFCAFRCVMKSKVFQKKKGSSAIDYKDVRRQSDDELGNEIDSADEVSSSSVANELYYRPLLFSTFNVKPSPQRQIVLRNQENLIPTPYQQLNKEIEERLGRMKVSARRSTHEWQRELRSVVALERRRSFSEFSLQMRSSEIVYQSLPRAGSLRNVCRSYISVGLVSRGTVMQASCGHIL